MKRHIFNVSTRQKIVIDMTPQEIAEKAQDEVNFAAKEALREKKRRRQERRAAAIEELLDTLLAERGLTPPEDP